MPHPRPTWPRRLRRVCVFLALGLVTTVGVAWGSAVVWRPAKITPGFLVEEGPTPHREVIVSRCLGGRSMLFSGFFVSEADLRAHRQRVNHWELELRPALDVRRNRLATTHDWMDQSDPAGLEVEVVARGWPWLALQCRLRTTYSSRQYEVRHAFAIPSTGPAADELANAVLLPYLPCWPGLIADALVFGAAFAGLHQLTRLGQVACRWRRRRRGRCAGCGYDLTGIDGACPECGSGQPGQGATPAKGTDDV